MTEAIKAPRAVFLPWPMGHHFGVPFDRELQRRVLMEMLDMLTTAKEPGAIHDLPIKWAEVRRRSKSLTPQGQSL